MPLKEEKNVKLYHSIKEVARLFGVNESTLRFWETKFNEISPRKTPNGTRYYAEEDIENVRLIYHLVKERGLTLAGARQKLDANKETTVNHEVIATRLKKLRIELTNLAEALKKIEQTNE
jgi:DNA-binding transcriptional MerR regulator